MSFQRFLNAAALVFFVSTVTFAQKPVDPAGHWEGSIETPSGMKMPFEVDLTRSSQGQLAATYTSATEKVKGLPFLKVAAAGQVVTLQIRENGTLTGTMAADGKTIAGNFVARDLSGAEIKLPFMLSRTGAARVEPRPTSARISSELAGTWEGPMDVNGFKIILRLQLSNHSTSASIGSLVNVTRGEAEIPISDVVQNASNVTFQVKTVAASFSGTLDSGGTELSGTWTQETGARPLTFRRIPSSK